MTGISSTRSLRAALLSAATFTAAAVGLSAPAAALVTPDTVTPASVVDTANTRPYWVGLMIRNEAGSSGGSCSGLLINPRTVLFAAHCVDGLAPAAYDGNSPGNRAQVGYTTDPTFGRTNLREWLFGQDFAVPAGDARVADASSVMVWYDPRSRNGSAHDPNNGTFLPADVAIAGFDKATELLGRDAQSGIGLLFTPVSGAVPVVIGGYGASGNGLTGARTAGTVEESYYRRLGSNMMDFLGDERTISVAVYGPVVGDYFNPGAPTTYQDLYWADFDDPQHATRPFSANVGRSSTGNTFDFNIFGGFAVTGESITGSGDSGSPLITNAFGREVSLGVLSQGTSFFFDAQGNPDDDYVFQSTFSNFGTAAGYNPLFLFWDQIVVNNPYKYVQAAAGNGEWTDAAHWVQEIDPLFYTLVGGNLTNALPTTPALGSSSAAPNVGTVAASPAPVADCAVSNTSCPPTGGTGGEGEVPAGTAQNEAPVGSESLASLLTVYGEDAASTTGAGLLGRLNDLVRNISAAGEQTLADAGSSNQAQSAQTTVAGSSNNEAQSTQTTITPGSNNEATAAVTALWSSGTLIGVNTGALTGPGSTNFVPNNTNGTAGLQNSAGFFEVNLRNAGTTFLTGTTVTIDRLSIRAASAGLNIRAGAQLNTTISSFLDAGTFTVAGVFSPSRLTVGGGLLTGTGSILTTASSGAGLLVNGGLLSPGAGLSTVGTLAVTGNTAFTLAGVYGVDLASALSADRLNVTGQLQLGGGLAVNALSGYIPTFGTTWTVANASSGITGQFATVATNLPGVLRPQVSVSGNNLLINIIALPFSTAASYTSDEQKETARGLDQIRNTAGGYTALSGLFNQLDQLPVVFLPGVLETLVPLNGFVAGGVAEANTALIAGSLVDRSDQLIGGGGHGFDGAAATAMLNASALQAYADPFDAMMAGSVAVAAAQDEAAAAATSIKLREGWGGFVDVATMIDTKYEATPFAGDADLNGTGGSIGLDYGFSDGSFAGAALSYVSTDADVLSGLQSADSDSWGLSAYGGVHEGDSFLTGYVGYAFQSYDLSRAVLLPTVQTLTASPDGTIFSAGAKMGFDLEGAGGVFTPYASIDGKWINIDGYTEAGGSAAMTVASIDTALVDGRIGLTYKGLFAMDGGVLRPKLGVAYVIDVQSDANVLNSAFAGFPSAPLTYIGADRDNGWVEYEAGLEYDGGNFGLSVNYTGGDNGVLKYNTLSGRISFSW